MQAEVECVNQTVDNESENRNGGIAIFSEVKCRFPPSRKLFFWRNPRSLHYFRGCSPFPPALGNDGVYVRVKNTITIAGKCGIGHQSENVDSCDLLRDFCIVQTPLKTAHFFGVVGKKEYLCRHRKKP